MKFWRSLIFILVAFSLLFLGTPAYSSDIFYSAKQDLAEKLHIDPEKITLYEYFDITWPDTSLGCPEEGYVYAQILTPGYRMIFQARKKPYIYHTDTSSNIVLCSKKDNSRLVLLL